MEHFCQEAGTRSCTGQKKVDCYGKVTFLYGMTGVNQVDDLTSADKVIPE